MKAHGNLDNPTATFNVHFKFPQKIATHTQIHTAKCSNTHSCTKAFHTHA